MTPYQFILWIVSLFVPACLFAQTGPEIPVSLPDSIEELARQNHRVPALTLSVPDPFRKGYFGVVGAGLIAQSRTRITGEFFDPDGNASLGFGLGNPEKVLGIEARMNIYGLASDLGAPGNLGEGTFDFHISRHLENDLWLGAGVFNLFGWDLEPPNKLESYYIVGTKGLHFNEASKAFSSMYISVGMGNGRFRADEDYSILDEAPWNFFTSVAVQVLPEGNFIVEWNGFNMFSGLSVLPIKKWPMQMIIGMDDIFHENRKLIIAGSLSFHLFQKSNKAKFFRSSILAPPPPQTSRVF